MPPRYDLYGPIHKGLGHRSAQLLIALGSTDWHDAQATDAMLADLTEYLGIAREHLAHEDAEIHPVLHGVFGEVGESLDHDHAEHHHGFVALDAAIAAVAAASAPDARAAAGHALYLRFARHFGEDLAHMGQEESVAQPLLHQHYDDAALQAIEGRILASIPPERMVLYHRMMLPALSPFERAMMLRAIAAGAPPEVYAFVRDIVARDCLAPAEHARLVADLTIAA